MAVTFAPLSRGNGSPLREQVRVLLAALIEGGELAPGEQLPTEAELARSLEVSLAPVRSALSDLADAGMIRRQAGLGTFVAERPISIEIDLLPSFTQTLRLAGVDFDTRVIRRERATIDAEVSELFGDSPPREAVWIRRSATVFRRRVVVLDSWLPIERFGGMLEDARIDEPKRSLYAYLADQYGVHLTPGEGRLSIGPCGDDLLPHLDLQFGAPIATYQTRGFDEEGRVAEVTRVHYDASHFVFLINRERA